MSATLNVNRSNIARKASRTNKAVTSMTASPRRPADGASDALKRNTALNAATLSSTTVGDNSLGMRRSDAEPIHELPMIFAGLLDEYMKSLNDRDEPVIRLRSPDQLKDIFESSGAALEMVDGEKPYTVEQLTTAAEQLLRYSVRTGSPLFFNQLYARADPVGIAADWISDTTSTNVHTYEVAPVYTMMEHEVLAKVARQFRLPTHDGLLVPGGSISNLYAIHLARFHKDPEFATKGNQHGAQLVAFTSDQAHYSYKKAAMVTGLGLDNLVLVESDETGRMKPEAFRMELEKCIAAGKKPFFVGCTAATTVLGAFDPYNEIREIATEFDVWMHVDGSWGGAMTMSDKHRHVMSGSEKADSVGWNPHKFLGAPMQCSVFLTKHEGLLQECNATNAAYLFQPDKLNADMDIGDKSIQCGRRADMIKLWMIYKAYGDKGLEKRVDQAVELAEHLQKRVEENPAFQLAFPRSFTNLGFWYVPKSMRPFNFETATQEECERLASVAPPMKLAMQQEGDAMIGFQPCKGRPNFWRMVFCNTWEANFEDIDALVDRMEKYGDNAAKKIGIDA